MSFIDSYKRLEKLCSEIYSDNHGLSTYIDEMLDTPDGSYYVSGWNEDLKQLKHYRWVRNQIVHEPNCTEENMCEPGDMQWIDNFYSRIMSITDPLALYGKAKSPRKEQNPIQDPIQNLVQNTMQNSIQKPLPKLVKKPQQTYLSNKMSDTNQQDRKTSSELTGALVCLIGVLIVAVIFIVVMVYIANIYHLFS